MQARKEPLVKVSRVRERGQFTVPQEVRKALSWPKGEIVVMVTPLPDEDGFKVERVNTATRAPRKKPTDEEWDAILESMQRIGRSGKAINLAEFVSRDRESH